MTSPTPGPARRVRFDCRLAGQPGDTPLYADLTADALAGVLQLLHDYQAGTIPPYALITVEAGPKADAAGERREFRVWRVARLMAMPDEELLYERGRPDTPTPGTEHPDGT